MVTTAIRVVVADDDPRVRSDIGRFLHLEPDIEMVGDAADGSLAVELCLDLRPDVCVMDIRMPVLDGIAATRMMRERTATHVLVMTTFDVDEYVLGAVRAGAAGFLLKDEVPDHLAAAVRTVAAGDGIVSPRATTRLLRALVLPGPSERRAVAPLTDRETHVVRLMARGMSNQDIAAEARISRATVKTHVSSILSKLGRTSRIQVVVWAFEHGLAPDRLGQV